MRAEIITTRVKRYVRRWVEVGFCDGSVLCGGRPLPATVPDPSFYVFAPCLVHRLVRRGICSACEEEMLPHGLEPWTSRLLAKRSNQLSYESRWRGLADAYKPFQTQ